MHIDSRFVSCIRVSAWYPLFDAAMSHCLYLKSFKNESWRHASVTWVKVSHVWKQFDRKYTSHKIHKTNAIECQQNSIKSNCNMEFASRRFFQIQTTFKLAFHRPKSLQVTEVRCPKKIHSGANSTFVFKLWKDFVSIGKARQES